MLICRRSTSSLNWNSTARNRRNTTHAARSSGKCRCSVVVVIVIQTRHRCCTIRRSNTTSDVCIINTKWTMLLLLLTKGRLSCCVRRSVQLGGDLFDQHLLTLANCIQLIAQSLDCISQDQVLALQRLNFVDLLIILMVN